MTHVHEKEFCKLIEVLPTSRFRLCQAVELNLCMGRNGFVKPTHAMFRYMTQTVLQHIIKHKSVLAISRIFFFFKRLELPYEFTTMGVDGNSYTPEGRFLPRQEDFCTEGSF